MIPTLTQRIELLKAFYASKSPCDVYRGCEQTPPSNDCVCMKQATEAALILFPELFSSPPTGWIAPVEFPVDVAMPAFNVGQADLVWDIIRDAYLSRQVKP